MSVVSLDPNEFYLVDRGKLVDSLPKIGILEPAGFIPALIAPGVYPPLVKCVYKIPRV
jgi:hypothetical protein